MWVHMRTSVANGKSYALQEREPLLTRHVSVSFRLVGIHKLLGCTSPRISWLATALGDRRNGGAYEQRDCNGTEDTAGPHEGEYVGRLVATRGRLATKTTFNADHRSRRHQRLFPKGRAILCDPEH